ncbi:MAG: hypothetical protein UY23_C0001G0188 [Candidatus Jorgensenbacteria bacterium GW2011_GWA1_48_11]|uniref:Uncharacterized protein n=1 Tax=Candidatus Jorgensenbacteria bacterium GW2011_GWA1_48_11 TaxID=1618660 RepID=A0A0G1UBS6_9BACT|nr:MAG: hypothetical protein UY23_C0001G0188 [Candidatus Jorgensenbacteria bacterium GW2011_GWA1_48_11]KKW12075.1 MAG: hypothetical protein UY51_C0005G0317 [Candidatus Jorgensenbacteria bacterium GW2011_GWB1_49_9]
MFGVFGAWLINKTPVEPKQKSLIETAASNGFNSSLEFRAPNSPTNPLTPYSDTRVAQNQDNLTDKLAELYTKEVLNRNSAGLSTDVNGQPQLAVPSTDVLSDILQNNLSQGVTFKEFNNKDIRIVSDNSVSAQINYIQTLGSLTQKNLGSLNADIFAALDKFMNKNDQSALQNQITAMNNQIHDVLALSVPALWQQFDLQALNLWQKSLTIYQGLLAVNDDPLKSYLVLNQFADIFQEAQSLNSVLTDRYNELTLKQ